MSRPFRDSSSCPRSHPGLRTTFGNHIQVFLITLASSNLKCVDPTGSGTMQTWPRRSPVNNQQRNLDAHISSYIFCEDLYRSNRITTYVVPFVIGMLLARDSIVGISIPSSISLPASLFTRSVIHHPATNSLVAMLARLIVMCITEWAQRYLSDNRSDKS